MNEGFKAHMHRPRPVHVRDFGGDAAFQPFYRPGGNCTKNCSFPSGETTAAFWMLAPACLVLPPLRGPALGMALLFGCATGVLRIAAGAHFLSDVLFSGWLMGLLIAGSWYVTRRYALPSRKAEAGLHDDLATL